MKMRVLVSALVLCGVGGGALAQTAEAQTALPPGATAAPAVERDSARSPGDTNVARPFNPDAAGDDKINGLEVPRMKDPRDGGRE